MRFGPCGNQRQKQEAVRSVCPNLDCEAGPSTVTAVTLVGRLTACLLVVLGVVACGGPAKSVAAGAAVPGKRVSANLVDADSILIVDGNTGQVLFAKNADQTREVASVQKLVTALVILDAGNLDKPVTVTAQDASCRPTKLPGSVDGTYTRRELLEAMLVLSANDAARALARDNAGSEAAFGAKMTALARRLGARNSVFKDSAGFAAAGQHSTAQDMMKIVMAAYENPLIRQATRTTVLPWRRANGKMVQLRNSNRILHRHAACRGMKVGYTADAGHCAAIAWDENGRRLFAVVLRGRSEMFWLQTGVAMKLHAHGLL